MSIGCLSHRPHQHTSLFLCHLFVCLCVCLSHSLPTSPSMPVSVSLCFLCLCRCACLLASSIAACLSHLLHLNAYFHIAPSSLSLLVSRYTDSSLCLTPTSKPISTCPCVTSLPVGRIFLSMPLSVSIYLPACLSVCLSASLSLSVSVSVCLSLSFSCLCQSLGASSTLRICLPVSPSKYFGRLTCRFVPIYEPFACLCVLALTAVIWN